MAIVKMKKLRLLAVKSDSEAVLKELQRQGCLEVTEQTEVSQDEELAGILTREPTYLAKCRTELLELQGALKVLDKYAPVKSKLLSARPLIEREEFLGYVGLEQSLEAASRIQRLEERIHSASVEEGRQKNLIESLTPWTGLDIPLENTGTRLCAAVTATVPSSADLDELDASLAEAVEEAQLFRISSGKEQHCLLLLCLRERLTEALEAMRSFGYAPSSLAGMTGTVRENIAAAEEKISAFEKEKQELIAEITARSDQREPLKLSADRVSTKMSLAEARERLLGTETAVYLTGWVSQPDIESVTAVLEKYDCAWALEDPREEEYPNVPVELKNSRLTRSLNMVTEMYSLPAYGTVDPNPLMAPFFIVFYGMMMADMAYGLLMIIAGILVTKKARPRGTMSYMFELMIPCGISTVVWGAMTGGFLGDFIPQLLLIINPESTFEWFWPPLFTPLDDTISILIGAMILGFIQLITGTVVSFVSKARAGNLMDGIWDEATWWVIFIGIGLAVLGAGNIGGLPVVLIIGILMLVVGAGRNAKGFGKITAAFGAIYNGVTGYFGDILSYSRLMALMLAGSVIAQVFNTLGAIPGNVVIFIIISLAGNTLNFILNLLSCFVHDLRLQCLEYFGKFYEDGGKPFRPLAINTKFYDIVKE